MTSVRDSGTSAYAEVVQPAGRFADLTSRGDPLARLFALLPSTGHLEAVASGTGLASGVPADTKAGEHAAMADVSPALLTPLESLPPFVALDAVRRRAFEAKSATD